VITHLTTAIESAKKVLHRVMHVWEVKNYPNFLESSGVTEEGWDLMKLKFQLRMLEAVTSGEQKKWTIAFMGSSVTAGRDSAVNASFVALTEKMLSSVLSHVGITVKCNQNAHEANPCIPYNLCVHAYAGPEADMVHWEQDYNCGGSAVYAEMFIRSALLLPNKPIVVFSHSATENWRPDACATPPKAYDVTAADRELVRLFVDRPKSLFTGSNMHKGHLNRKWYHMTYYKAAGVQSFWHQARTYIHSMVSLPLLSYLLASLGPQQVQMSGAVRCRLRLLLRSLAPQ
jgi:hypothetical protein